MVLPSAGILVRLLLQPPDFFAKEREKRKRLYRSVSAPIRTRTGCYALPWRRCNPSTYEGLCSVRAYPSLALARCLRGNFLLLYLAEHDLEQKVVLVGFLQFLHSFMCRKRESNSRKIVTTDLYYHYTIPAKRLP